MEKLFAIKYPGRTGKYVTMFVKFDKGNVEARLFASSNIDKAEVFTEAEIAEIRKFYPEIFVYSEKTLRKNQRKGMPKRKTKKEIYAEFGIEYDPKTDHILAPDGNWIPLFLKQGNEKLGPNVWTFSLPAGTRGTCVCDCEGCYAKTGRYIFDNVVESLERNRYYVEKHPDFFRRALQAQIKTLRDGSEIRIHAAGDFHTANMEVYAGIWLETVGMFPADKFWTYTKVRRYETLFDSFENGNVVKSVTPCGINYGHCDYIIAVRNALIAMGKKVHVCKCGTDHDFHCEGCGKCLEFEYVLFLEHSTDYVAENDPLYPEILRIIAEQDATDAAAVVA